MFRRLLSTDARLQHFKVLVAGGGAGGASVANALGRKLGANNVGVVEPEELHYYQPMWTLVGAGLKQFSQSYHATKDVLTDASWIKKSVEKFEPDQNFVMLSDGTQVKYDVLVVAIGFRLFYEKIKGLPEALKADQSVCSNYHRDFVKKTLPAIQNCQQGGNAIFTFPDTPIKCPGAPQKIMYLAEECFRKAGKQVHIHYCTPANFMFGVKHYNPALERVCDQRKIIRLYRHVLVEVDHKNRQAHFEIRDDDCKPIGRKVLEYSMLHIGPPCITPDILNQNKVLVDNCGFLNLDKHTLQHVKFENVFGLGDCTSLPTSKTAAAAAVQSGVLQRNIIDFLEKRPFTAAYNGYASCPILTSSKTVVMPEFDYSMTPLETMPFDQSKESRILYHMKADLMPALYWHGLVKGIWKGPYVFRRIFHPFGRH